MTVEGGGLDPDGDPEPDPDPEAGDVLFEETFSGYTAELTYGLGDLSTTGWTGTTADAEICYDGYAGVVGTDADEYWLDTQKSPGGMDITHAVADVNGGQALISFTAAYQPLSSGTLEFLWNNQVVKSISSADFAGANMFATFTVLVDSDVDGTNTLQIRDTGMESNFGFALDGVIVNDWLII